MTLSNTRSFSAALHNALIRVYDGAGNVIETYEHKGDFKKWVSLRQNKSRHAVRRDG
jgi:hypothetical protein